jgi:hypothetical protein
MLTAKFIVHNGVNFFTIIFKFVSTIRLYANIKLKEIWYIDLIMRLINLRKMLTYALKGTC